MENMQSLSIENCNSLEKMEFRESPNALQNIDVNNCDNLSIITILKKMDVLKNLSFKKCGKLRTLSLQTSEPTKELAEIVKIIFPLLEEFSIDSNSLDEISKRIAAILQSRAKAKDSISSQVNEKYVELIKHFPFLVDLVNSTAGTEFLLLLDQTIMDVCANLRLDTNNLTDQQKVVIKEFVRKFVPYDTMIIKILEDELQTLPITYSSSTSSSISTNINCDSKSNATDADAKDIVEVLCSFGSQHPKIFESLYANLENLQDETVFNNKILPSLINFCKTDPKIVSFLTKTLSDASKNSRAKNRVFRILIAATIKNEIITRELCERIKTADDANLQKRYTIC
jgi:hypothetical protein